MCKLPLRVFKTLFGHIFPHVFMSIFGKILALHMHLNYSNKVYGGFWRYKSRYISVLKERVLRIP